jgi:hypothetical protein
VERCHLYLPLIDSSGAAYLHAEVTLLDEETGRPIEEPVYLLANGGSPQEWPILVNPAVIDLWTDTPMRVTVQALLPGGATFTRPGVDICAPPADTVRTTKPLHIASAEGVSNEALLVVSPDGTADWQVLDVLRFHQHGGDAPEGTVLGLTDLKDVYPGQTWLTSAASGSQGSQTVVVGSGATVNADEAVAIGRATAGLRGVGIGGGASGYTSSVAIGAMADTAINEQVALGHSASAWQAQRGAVVLGANTSGDTNTRLKVAKGLYGKGDDSLIFGQGDLPDLSWHANPYVAFINTVVTGRFFGSRSDASVAGPASALGFYGAAGQTVPLVNSTGVTTSTPGRAALLSLLSALDQLGLVYLTDGTIDDELADWSKTYAHDPNLVLETGDGDGSKAGDLNRAKRNAAGPGWVTYFLDGGIRDFRVRVFAWQSSGPDPAALAASVVADISADGVTWTRIPLSWQPMTATAASWYQSWATNTRALPSPKYLRLTLDTDPSVYSPQIGRVIVRPANSLTAGFGSGGFGQGAYGG